MINYLSKPFKWFFKLEAASGLVLLFAAIIALIISNSNLAELYFSTLNKYLFIGINNFGLKLSVLHWINDALMAIFFFFVTLEIKREFLQGELSNIKQALLPIIASAVKKTFNDKGTLLPNSDRTPKENAISVAEGIAHPFKVSLSPKFINT